MKEKKNKDMEKRESIVWKMAETHISDLLGGQLLRSHTNEEGFNPF